MDAELRAFIDKAAVAEVVQTERAARDAGEWARMADCYHPDSLVSISWIEATGHEFVEASRRAFAEGVRHLHQMAPSLVTLNGDRALAQTGCAILLAGRVGEVEVNVTCQARLCARAEKRYGLWRLSGFRAMYFQDALAAKNPAEVPRLDPVRLASYRPSYRFLSYVVEEAGKPARHDLAGVDRPDLVEALRAGEEAWLKG
jgi:hypothetical protein